jgi:DNA-binding GntR family transcriptional regulator
MFAITEVMAVQENRSPMPTETAYDDIMDAIVTQRLAPSQKVSENVLTEMFDISRSTARNIMEQLTAQQFLVSVSPRITRIAALTMMDVKQNFAMRKMLHPNIFAMAAAQIDFNEFVKLSDATECKGVITEEAEALTLLKANRKSNVYVAQHVQYPLMIDWVRQLENTAMRIYWLYIKMKGTLPYTWADQKALLNAVKHEQPAEIRLHAQNILSKCEDRVLEAIFLHEQLLNQDLYVANT